MAENIDAVKKEAKTYLIIFAALLVLTAVNVTMHYLKFPLVTTVMTTLLVAALQATLALCHFMHLLNERKIIFLILGFTLIFVIGLLVLPAFENHNRITGSQIVH